jgi:hypothetical protein
MTGTTKRRYIGNGVYVENERDGIAVCTDRGPATVRIYLAPANTEALVAYLRELGIIPALGAEGKANVR